MDEMSYQVVITGIIKGTPWLIVMEEFARLLRISFHESQTRLEQIPCIVRSQLSHREAELYCRVLGRIGVIAECIGYAPASLVSRAEQPPTHWKSSPPE